MRGFFTAMFLFAFGCNTFSQVSKAEFHKETLLRFNPLGLIDIVDENLSTGIEYKFHATWSTGSDIGWIFFAPTQNRNANGLIVRPFIRHYIDKYGIGFIEAELHYKYVNYKIRDWLGRLPTNNVPAYQEYTTFHYKKNAAGIHFKAGVKTNISRNNRLKFEFTGGIGIRWTWQGARDGIYNRINAIGNGSATEYFGPVVPVNMRLLYVLK